MRENLEIGQKITRKCLEREKLKKLQIMCHNIGIFIIKLKIKEFEKTKSEIEGKPINPDNFKNDFKELENEIKIPTKNQQIPIKDEEKSVAISEKSETKLQINLKAIMENPLEIKDKSLIANYDYAAIILKLSQLQEKELLKEKELSKKLREEKEKLKARTLTRIKKRKRIGKHGDIFIDRKIISGVLLNPVEPEWNIENNIKTNENTHENIENYGKLPNIIQRNEFSNIYEFYDDDEKLDDLDKRYKNLSTGFKNFLKHRRKQIKQQSDKSITY